MNHYTHRFLTIMLYIALPAGAALLCFNPAYKALTLSLYAAFSALILYHHLKFYTLETKLPAGKYFLLAELVLAFSIQYLDQTGFVEVYLFILMADAILAYPVSFSAPYTTCVMLGYIVNLYHKAAPADLLQFWRAVDATLMLSSVYIAMLYVARYNLDCLRDKHHFTETLKAQAGALETANAKLQSYADELEENADLRAREALMRELHDKLGHQLTTASIGTQAARILVEKNPEAARERLSLVTEQLQEAMQSLREVIQGNGLPMVTKPQTFLESLMDLLSETQRRTGITMAHNLGTQRCEDYAVLTRQQQIYIYNALMEGITNGIRHGGATAFEFCLEMTRSNSCHFCLKDNGSGFKAYTPGFGLIKMQKEAQKLGASLKLESTEGCRLEIDMQLLPQTTEPQLNK